MYQKEHMPKEKRVENVEKGFKGWIKMSQKAQAQDQGEHREGKKSSCVRIIVDESGREREKRKNLILRERMIVVNRKDHM